MTCMNAEDNLAEREREAGAQILGLRTDSEQVSEMILRRQTVRLILFFCVKYL